MASSAARTVEEYIASLPADRRPAIEAVRRTLLANLPPGFDESMMWGMITYSVPLSRCPDTYNGQPLSVGALASQKGHMAVYLMAVYADDDARREFETAYRATGKRLDMGKSCVRFKRLEDLPLDVIGQAIGRFGVDEFITRYQAAHAAQTRAKNNTRTANRATKKPTRTVSAAKSTKKPAARTASKSRSAKKLTKKK